MTKPEKRPFKAAIFDLDGTLACTLPDLRYSANAMLTACGYPEQPLTEIMKYINDGVYGYIQNLMPKEAQKDENAVSHCLEVYTAIYSQHYCDNTYVYEGLEDVIRTMKERGIWLAVHTNKEHSHACGMVEKLLPGLFDYILGDGHCPPKPDPTGSHMVAEKAGLTAADFVFIGDSNVDMATAVNAGMYPVGVTWGYRDESVLWQTGAKAVVHKPEELLTILFG